MIIHVGLILHWIYKTIFNTRVKFRFDYLHSNDYTTRSLTSPFYPGTLEIYSLF